jgi:hypothetical protein
MAPVNLRRMASCVSVLLLLLLAACYNPLKARHGSYPPPTSTGLPAFSDWRGAYIGADWRVHAVSADGKHDVIGAQLPDLAVKHGVSMVGAAVAPNGRYIAYPGSDVLRVLDLTG